MPPPNALPPPPPIPAGNNADIAAEIEGQMLVARIGVLGSRLQTELDVCASYERKVPLLRQDSVLLDEDVMELTRRLDKAQRLLIQKEAERMAIESMADFMRERSGETQREIDEIRGLLTRIVPIAKIESHNGSRHHSGPPITPTHYLPQAPLPPPPSGQPPNLQLQGQEGTPCLDFNKHNCNNPNCSRPHTCLYCRSSTHSFLTCDQKGCICVYYNKNECDVSKCARINICLFCLGDHAINRCPEISEDARNDMKDICNNWNAMSFCQTDQCRRTHRCLRCQEKHTTFECPLNIDTYYANPTIQRIYNLYKTKVIVVRHEPYNTNARYGIPPPPPPVVPATASAVPVAGGKSSGGAVARDRGYRDDEARERGGWERSGSGRGGDDDYRKRGRGEEENGGGGSSWRAGDSEVKRSRGDDESRRDSTSGGGGRYSKRRDDEPAKTLSPRRDESARRRDRSTEQVPGYENRERSGVTGSGGAPGANAAERMNPCFAFNEKGSCPHSQRCWYRHACIKCDSFSHGEFECPKRLA
ncbi:hypothetical protein HDU98_001494 [Podochytrium sp. JEL0797]|nr:hypothetical protein HDU98_001494 [Podochytrium sp. JEL0797]